MTHEFCVPGLLDSDPRRNGAPSMHNITLSVQSNNSLSHDAGKGYIGWSTEPSIDAPMIPFASIPASVPALGTDRKPAFASSSDTLPDLLWKMHLILVNPNSKAEEARKAKERMVSALEGGTMSLHPGMVVAPMSYFSTRQNAGNVEPGTRGGRPRSMVSPLSSFRTIRPRRWRKSPVRSVGFDSRIRRAAGSNHL